MDGREAARQTRRTPPRCGADNFYSWGLMCHRRLRCRFGVLLVENEIQAVAYSEIQCKLAR
jgi:hypothetical protein